MKITIHRGTNQIGGCVTEYEHNGWRLFVDYGEQLPGAPVSEQQLEFDGLTCGDISKSALLITHYHGDHIGKVVELPANLPIFMGETAKEIQTGYSKHLKSVSKEHRQMTERLTSVSTFSPGKPFAFGDFQVMPIVIDHSAFDAYAFRIEADEVKVFHTGDFRTHGFRSKNIPKVIGLFIGKVDYVVCEATNINRPNTAQMSERELQRQFKDDFRANKYNVVYPSSTNIDRLFSLYHAALSAKLPFYVDSYQKRIMDIARKDIIWGKSKFYQYKSQPPTELLHDGAEFRVTPKFKDYLAKRGYVLIARANRYFDRLIEQMPSEGRKTYLSMWNGYVDKTKAAYNQKLAQSLGNDYILRHTSGHCDMLSLEKLIAMLQPKAIIPIHTDNPSAFADQFHDRWQVQLLHDGEPFLAKIPS